MLYFEAASWADLVELAHPSSSYSDSITIKLTSDIDCNREIPEGVEATLSFPASGSGVTVTIDGGYDESNANIKRHYIRNLRSHVITPVTLFSTAYNSIIFRNLDLINIVLDANLASCGDNGPIIINNCRMVGRRSVNMFPNDRAIKLYNSYFNVPYIKQTPVIDAVLLSAKSSTTSTENSKYAYFCRFKETYGDWAVDDTKPCTSFGNLNMCGCYVSGEIVGGEVLILTNKYSYAASIQNAIDADLKTTAAENTTISVQAPKGIWRDDIHSTDSTITGTYSYTNVNSDSAIPETPAHMKDATQLYNDGFDIVHESGDTT